MIWSEAAVWWLIAGLGLGTYAIRFSFLGLVGDRELPPWALRLLRYTAVAVLPGIVAPALLNAGGGIDPLHVGAVAAAVAAGAATRSAMWGMGAGMAALVAAMLV